MTSALTATRTCWWSFRQHFHAYYREASAVYAVDSIECIGGSLSRTQSRLVEAWAELHREENLRDWELPQSGHPPMKIAPRPTERTSIRRDRESTRLESRHVRN